MNCCTCQILATSSRLLQCSVELLQLLCAKRYLWSLRICCSDNAAFQRSELCITFHPGDQTSNGTILTDSRLKWLHHRNWKQLLIHRITRIWQSISRITHSIWTRFYSSANPDILQQLWKLLTSHAPNLIFVNLVKTIDASRCQNPLAARDWPHRRLKTYWLIYLMAVCWYSRLPPSTTVNCTGSYPSIRRPYG